MAVENFENVPFSSRNRAGRSQVDNDCPESARAGLLHLLVDVVEKRYVANWCVIARELQRIARLSPAAYSLNSVASERQARVDAEEVLNALGWDKVYDFCERLFSHLAVPVGYHYNDEFHEETSKADVQSYISAELQRLFMEEGLVFEFADGVVKRQGRQHTVNKTTKAQVVLGDARLAAARTHYDKALKFFRNPSSPDYENCVKEAVCAVEAAGKTLFPEAKASTLGILAKWFSSSAESPMPSALAQTFTGMYGYRNGGDGVAHGGVQGGAATVELAEYVLAVCASQIIYLVDLSNGREEGIPF